MGCSSGRGWSSPPSPPALSFRAHSIPASRPWSFPSWLWVVQSSHATLIDFGLSLSARGRNKARMPSRYSGLDAVRVDLDGHCHGPIEATGASLAAMQRRLLRIANRSFARQSDGAALHLHV